jgi:hypothetical protein
MTYEGEITEINLIEKLLEFAEERFTGAVRFENESIIKIIYYRDGDVLSASTNDRADSIDEILLGSGKASREHIKQALARRKETETLGDALLSLGFITRKELTWARRLQLIGVIRSLSRWTSGTYTIVADYLPKREEGTSFFLPQVIAEMVVTDDDRQKIERELDGGTLAFELTPTALDRYRRLGLNHDADAILEKIDGRATAFDLTADSRLDSFSVYKLLYAFSLLGITHPVRRGSGSEFATIAAAEDEALLEVLQSPADDWDYDPADDCYDETLVTQPVETEFAVGELAIDAAGELASRPPAWSGEVPTSDELGSETESAAALDYGSERQGHSSFASSLEVDESLLVSWPEAGRLVVSDPIVPADEPRGRGLLVGIGAGVIVALVATGGWLFFRYEGAGQSVSPAVQTAALVEPGARLTPAATFASVDEAMDAEATISPALNESPAATSTAAPVEEGLTADRSAAPSSDPVRARYEAMAQHYLTERASATFAYQVAFLCEVSSLTAALERGGAEVWFLPASGGGRDCYRVLWGRFPDRGAATAKVGEIPAWFRPAKPVIVRVNEVSVR